MLTYVVGLISCALMVEAQDVTIDYNRAPPNLSTLANNTLFETWRPRAHVLPPQGQIGDPCMHYTDPHTGLFHVGFLHLGASGATTSDFITYQDLNPNGEPFIRPGGINDPIAVFDGSVIPAGINGTPTLFYTSVSYLPIQWTIPYTKGSETQSLAVSTNGGRNFTKLQQGPSIPSPPFALDVTGFRDPFVFQDPTLDRLLDSAEGTWYAVISGGVRNVGPAEFLYRQFDPNFRDWEYLGQWWNETANSTWGDGTWAGRWGFNFEVANRFSLDEQGYNAEGEAFTTLGAEWSEEPIIPQVSQFREMLWASGNVTTDEDGAVQFTPSMAGKLDWGRSAYAAAGKLVPSTSQASSKSGAPDRFISYLWLTGDCYGTIDFPTNQQGWVGSLLLPRELSVGTIANVVDNGLAREIGSWRIAEGQSSNGTVNLQTLRQVLVREQEEAFVNNATRTITEPDRKFSAANGSASTSFTQSPDSKFYMLKSSLTFPSSARNSTDLKAGFEILSSEFETTKIYYNFANESIVIDRSNSSAAARTTDGIDTRNEAGRLRLFDIAQGAGTSVVERLDLTIIVDNGIVEVLANDRFGLSTWVWSWYESSKGISFLYEGTEEVEFGDVTIYEGLTDAWPERDR
ncbi:glycosyl hydrolase-like protein 3 [Elsinoe australis]|uniref:Glycosyl hydrolase-like protein 3 n=1 Tax=Elsinoe australis TaxID=40998 RepID=A0A4U7B3L3_9PEZI|nr:glycosyl hydrolase-like protein 3 [Elsinoe australis]